MKIGQLGQKAPDIIWNGPVRIYAKYLPLPKQAAFSSPSRWIFKTTSGIRNYSLLIVTYFSLFFFLCSTWTYSALFCSHCWGPGSVKFILPNIKLSIRYRFFPIYFKKIPVPSTGIIGAVKFYNTGLNKRKYHNYHQYMAPEIVVYQGEPVTVKQLRNKMILKRNTSCCALDGLF